MRLLLLYEITDISPVFCYHDCDSGNKIEDRKSVDRTVNTLLISSASYHYMLILKSQQLLLI